jgi:hypothetical protein
MRVRFALFLAACLAVAPSLASADDPPVYTVPPKPDFSSMNFLIGSWSCTSKSARRPSPATYTETYAIDPTGYYLIDELKIAPVPWANYAQDLKFMITFDRDIKLFASELTSTLGDYGLSTSPGWVDGKLVWHLINNTPSLDVASSSDLTVTRVSDTQTTSVTSFTTKSGNTVGVTGSCTKST